MDGLGPGYCIYNIIGKSKTKAKTTLDLFEAILSLFYTIIAYGLQPKSDGLQPASDTNTQLDSFEVILSLQGPDLPCQCKVTG